MPGSHGEKDQQESRASSQRLGPSAIPLGRVAPPALRVSPRPAGLLRRFPSLGHNTETVSRLGPLCWPPSCYIQADSSSPACRREQVLQARRIGRLLLSGDRRLGVRAHYSSPRPHSTPKPCLTCCVFTSSCPLRASEGQGFLDLMLRLPT